MTATMIVLGSLLTATACSDQWSRDPVATPETPFNN
jgi:hypothetical protein